ncbi:acyl-CoA dehydrogenase family protein [Niveispirillum sp. BGYR6]|uniref:acyl-CoA dehydrogenase family protein n=1 Tax=Niveispirillum sp. BGYR6 TaxID=2971249 RepID=UPI0022B94B98|nr:acyl-CoA dehydrogenase family protein [Niveispirillum sp. BGYR6]MDG5496125.1 acyl-CoA/acyl-ACP dehydrogenase [Niveispirillum sp. BGYR6]
MTGATITRFPRESATSPVDDAILAELTQRFAATAGQHDRDATFPSQNIALLHQHRLLALTAPREWGGREADLATALKVVQAVAKGEPATALVLVMQYLHHARIKDAGFPEHLARHVVGDAVQRGALINSLRVEPDLGTPARGGLPATVARRVSDGWRISGRKLYSTGSTVLDWFVVWARSDDETPLVGGWLVPAKAPGIRIEETWDHHGLRASVSHDVVLEDVWVPADHALSPQPVGGPPAFDPGFLRWANVLTAGIYDAVAQAARDWFIGWAKSRVPANLGAPLSSLPRYQETLGTIDGLLLTNRLLLQSAAAQDLGTVEANLIKHLVTENAIAAVEKAIAIGGNPALTRANPLERHYRDVLCGRIHMPQADVVLTAAGRKAFA